MTNDKKFNLSEKIEKSQVLFSRSISNESVIKDVKEFIKRCDNASFRMNPKERKVIFIDDLKDLAGDDLI